MAYLPRTAAAVRALATIDLSEMTRSTWHWPIVEEYRREVEGSPNILGEADAAHHTRVVGSLDSVVPLALGHPQQFAAFLLLARSTIEAIGESHGNTRELYRSFVSAEPSAKHTFLSLCLMYLILCEGVFKNQGRLLLGIRAVAHGRATPGDYLARPLSPKALVKELQDGGLDVYTVGYHRNIRNAIAHGHIRFRADADAMRFRDFDPSNVEAAVFDETWPFSRMASLYAKLDDTYLVVATYLQIHFLPLALGVESGGGTVH